MCEMHFFPIDTLFSSGCGSLLALSARGARRVGSTCTYGASLGPNWALWRLLSAFEVGFAAKKTWDRFPPRRASRDNGNGSPQFTILLCCCLNMSVHIKPSYKLSVSLLGGTHGTAAVAHQPPVVRVCATPVPCFLSTQTRGTNT